MKSLLLSLFVLSVFICQSQTIEKYYDYNWNITRDPLAARFYSITEFRDSLWCTKDYYVFEKTLQMTGSYKDSSGKIRHGEFTWYHPNGYLQGKGRFDNNKYEGSWIHYHQNGRMMDSAYYVNGKKFGVSLSWHYNGYMADSSFYYSDGSGVVVQWFDNGIPSLAGRTAAGGKMNGKWQFFHKNGNLSALETYENGQLMYKEYFDEHGVKQHDTTNRDRDVDFPENGKAWGKFLQRHVYWPPNLKFKTITSAVVMVRFAVNEEGNVVDVYVSLPLHPEFDRIALNAVKQSPRWQPAVSHNRKIKAYRTQPVTFVQVDE